MIHRLLAVAVSLFLAGCVVPVPHKRIHQFGVCGTVVDAKTLKPISGAFVNPKDAPKMVFETHRDGKFCIPPVTRWHGAYFFGPTSLSLLPAMDAPAPQRLVVVAAPRYVSREVTFRSLTSPKRVLDPQTIPLSKDQW